MKEIYRQRQQMTFFGFFHLYYYYYYYYHLVLLKTNNKPLTLTQAFRTRDVFCLGRNDF